MIHARNDYQRIQDPETKIPQDEPVFLLRAQDITSGPTLRHWIKLNKAALKADKKAKAISEEEAARRQKAIVLAEAHAYRMEEWQPKKAADV